MRVKSLQDLPRPIRQQAATTLAGVPRITEPGLPASARQGKYGATRTEVNGITFDSKWEAHRYMELLQLERVDQIQDLQVHVPFGLHVRAPDGETVRIASWTADFQYWREGRMVIEDTKSGPTRRKEAYVLKRKHFETEYGVRVLEVERNKPRLGV